jgi:DNA integrity scanning protein DisA with diadenylate cyclase activity
MPRLLHHTTTMTTLQKGKRSIKTIHLITPIFHLIQMLICYQFHLGNLHTLMEKTTLSGVIKCLVIYFLSILVSVRLLKTECILIVLTIPFHK